MEEQKVIVTGGAGYIGSVLVRLLLEKGYKVKVVDILRFGGESIVDLLNNENFDFVKADVREKSILQNIIDEGTYGVINLAAIVGDPACAKEPQLAVETNLEATKSLYEISNQKKIKKFIFASTCSNYGKMKETNQYVDENSELAPVSLYAETKVKAENFLLNQDKNNFCKPTILRFSTVYGISPRMRFDLTVNEFTKELALNRELVIYGEQFWRPYCHVVDLARSIVYILEEKDDEKVAFDVFNVGDTTENYTKKMLVDEMKKNIPNAKISYVKKDEDPRDYRVSFEKIKKVLGFRITKTVPEGIEQIKKAVEKRFFLNPDDKIFKNV